MSLVIFEDDLKKERASAEEYKRSTAAKLVISDEQPEQNPSDNILTLIIKSACHQALARLQHHMSILASMKMMHCCCPG